MISKIWIGLFWIGCCAIGLGLPGAVWAAPLFQFPIDCQVEKTCWIQNFVDVDPGPKAFDYRCGTRSFNTHKGTDFRLRNWAEMRQGVSVLATADGKVARLRDGVLDEPWTPEVARRLKGKKCGNGVVITHADGWESQYCHLKNGSIRVRPGHRVRPGEVIAEVGQSGMTEFPHVHVTFRHLGTVIDPFTGNKMGSGCVTRPPTRSLWHTRLSEAQLQRPVILAGGLLDAIPKSSRLRRSPAKPVSFDGSAPALAYWIDVIRLKKGDVITLRVVGPGDKVIASRQMVLNRDKAQYFLYVGRKVPKGGWPSGVYVGRAQIVRDGKAVSTQRVTISQLEN